MHTIFSINIYFDVNVKILKIYLHVICLCSFIGCDKGIVCIITFILIGYFINIYKTNGLLSVLSWSRLEMFTVIVVFVCGDGCLNKW